MAKEKTPPPITTAGKDAESVHLAADESGNVLAIARRDSVLMTLTTCESTVDVAEFYTLKTTQTVRCLALIRDEVAVSVHQQSGEIFAPGDPRCPPYVLVAGDGKMLQLYSMRNAHRGHVLDGSDPDALLSSFGPHSKRICAMDIVDYKLYPHALLDADCDRAPHMSVVFGDKTGEIHMVHLRHTRDGMEFALQAKFLLQHQSSIISLSFVASLFRASVFLFSADRDCHLRVSYFPQTHQIKQFLWGDRTSSAPVTCITVIRTSGVCEAAVVATGDSAGTVNFWCASSEKHRSEPESNDAPPFKCIHSFSVTSVAPDSLAATASKGVVGMTQLTKDTVTGLAVLAQSLPHVVFLPLSVTGHTVQKHPVYSPSIVALPSGIPGLALHGVETMADLLTGSTGDRCSILQRNGTLLWLTLECLEGQEELSETSAEKLKVESHEKPKGKLISSPVRPANLSAETGGTPQGRPSARDVEVVLRTNAFALRLHEWVENVGMSTVLKSREWSQALATLDAFGFWKSDFIGREKKTEESSTTPAVEAGRKRKRQKA